MEAGDCSIKRKIKRKGKVKVLPTSDRVGGRRPWSEHEDKCFIECLLQLVRAGQKTENGFRPGYQTKLETMMMTMLPCTDIRASPHINSKITQWKRTYGAIRGIIGVDSGIGFNTITCLIDCNNEQWDKAVKKDPSVANMRYKPWPFYHSWIETFGCDRATGSTAQDVFKMYSNIRSEEKDSNDDCDMEDESNDEDVDLSGDTQAQEDDAMESDTQTQCDSQAPKAIPPTAVPPKSRKRSSSVVTNNSDIDGLVTVLNKLVTSSDDRLGSLCGVIRYDSDMGKARQETFNMLAGIPNLSRKDKIQVSRILAKHTCCLEMFMGFPSDARIDYVYGLLSGEYNEDA